MCSGPPQPKALSALQSPRFPPEGCRSIEQKGASADRPAGPIVSIRSRTNRAVGHCGTHSRSRLGKYEDVRGPAVAPRWVVGNLISIDTGRSTVFPVRADNQELATDCDPATEVVLKLGIGRFKIGGLRP